MCMSVKYCRHEALGTHKKQCKRRAAEHEALFKDPPAKEDCPICFLPMPVKLIYCASLPPASMVCTNLRLSEMELNVSIIHVAGKGFVKGACTTLLCLEAMTSVCFATQR